MKKTTISPADSNENPPAAIMPLLAFLKNPQAFAAMEICSKISPIFCASKDTVGGTVRFCFSVLYDNTMPPQYGAATDVLDEICKNYPELFPRPEEMAEARFALRKHLIRCFAQAMLELDDMGGLSKKRIQKRKGKGTA